MALTSRKRSQWILGGSPMFIAVQASTGPMTCSPMAPTALPEEKGTIAMSRVGRDRLWTERGFSLLELLAVLLLLGLGSLIVVPSIHRGLGLREVRQSALELAAVARALRTRAVTENTPQQLIFSPLENSYQVFQGRRVLLSPNVKIAGIEGGEPVGEGMRRFLFFPNGSALGGEVGILGHDGSAYIIRVDGLSGRVVVARGRK